MPEPADLTLRCGAATLCLATEADDDLLVALLPDDFDHDPTFPQVPGRSLAQHREAWLRHWLWSFRHPRSAGDRYLPFVVEADGVPVGFQVLEAEGFEERHEVDSSSFLIPAARGRRLGVAMRTAVLALAFDVLGAERAVTAARPDNVASRLVSERVGYVPTGRRERVVAGAVRPIDTFELTRERWTTLDHPAVEITGEVPWLAAERRYREVAAEMAGARPMEQVWRNLAGALTFRVGDEEYVKVGPAGMDVIAEAERLRWASRYVPAPRVIDAGVSDVAWLRTAPLGGWSALDDRWAGREAEVARELGRALRDLHEALPVADCPWEGGAQGRVAALTPAAREALGAVPSGDIVVRHGDACVPNVLLDDASRWCGVLDLDHLGTGDRWDDVADLLRSIVRNFGAEHRQACLNGYGLPVDEARLAFYERLAAYERGQEPGQ